ncbi:MAG: ABC transporter substrate-binding protein [Chlorobiaceae bacterium]|nr:ABC transporter substrate-binding protein [Chlorobiaceae bacterium]
MGIPIGVLAEVMKRDNILRDAVKAKGLEIRVHPFLKGADLNFFCQRGQIDVGLSGDMPTIILAAECRIVIVALAKKGFSDVVAKKEMQITELKGKRIGYPPNSNAHYALLVALSSVGLKESDVRMIALDVNQMQEALHNNKIDAFAAWEPVPTLARAKYKDFVVVHRSLNESFMYFSRAMLNRHPDIARHLMASMIRAVLWMKKSENNLLQASKFTLEAGKSFLGWRADLTAEQIADITNRDLLELVHVPAIPEKDFMVDGPLCKEFEFLKTTGNLPESTKWEKIAGSLDRTLISEVVSNATTYRIYEFDYEFGGTKN